MLGDIYYIKFVIIYYKLEYIGGTNGIIEIYFFDSDEKN